jgi:pilus assembly protein Flp/PilA
METNMSLRKLFHRLGRDRRGATAIEYGLIVTLIGIGAMASFQTLGGGVAGGWNRMVGAVPVTN